MSWTDEQKISTGINDRPRNETVTGSSTGIPYDSSQMSDLTNEGIRRTKASLLRDRLDDLKDKLDEQVDLPQRGAP
ncbi:hypothetical protein [Rhizobium sp. K102]|jgi:hypothetical protein|uniref:hypothetical protein n=1 Tax=Rhizobium sp. K102 TaxID=2918527 RepID=UPI001EFB30A8|nr:hypothetical protein [Rhizobium sp. K102]ULR42322.1 hypothetical protein MHI61_02100 [Rhizobium sp. K102]